MAPQFRVPGIVYREIADLSAPAFTCDRFHANLSISTCADRWKAANQRSSDRYEACRGCFIGATHAGIESASRSPIQGKIICGRCQRGAMRLIWGTLCVSCYNRQREFLIGKNARGLPPVRLPKLAPRRVSYFMNGSVHTRRADCTASPLELVVATLRDARHSVAFGWRGATVHLRQQRLF